MIIARYSTTLEIRHWRKKKRRVERISGPFVLRPLAQGPAALGAPRQAGPEGLVTLVLEASPDTAPGWPRWGIRDVPLPSGA